MTPRGVDKALDVLFSTSLLNETIAQVLDDAGWLPPERKGRWAKFADFCAGLDSNANGRLNMGAIRILAVPAVAIALIVEAMTD